MSMATCITAQHQQAPNGQIREGARDMMRSDLVGGLAVRDDVGVADVDGAVGEEGA